MIPGVPILVAAGAFMIFLVNLFLTIREVANVRLETPDRVIEDEIQLHPEKAAEPRRPRNPWDEPDEGE